MKIRGNEYNFAYTIGAFSNLQELNAFEMNGAKQIMIMSVVMNKAYNDLMRLENPSYSADDLTLEAVQMLKLSDLAELKKEIEDAVVRDSKVTVKTNAKKDVKKNLGA